MPARNTIRFDLDGAYYHVYNRGVNKSIIFICDEDKDFFLALLDRYLSAPASPYSTKVNFNGKLAIVAYCIMDNHFHLLIRQHDQGALKNFMRALANSYIRYFNERYHRRGPLFESRYKACLIENTSYLEHLSRYIHLNPADWRDFRYSSINQYLKKTPSPEWLQPQPILELFTSSVAYSNFIEDYADHKASLASMKHMLADS